LVLSKALFTIAVVVACSGTSGGHVGSSVTPTLRSSAASWFREDFSSHGDGAVECERNESDARGVDLFVEFVLGGFGC